MTSCSLADLQKTLAPHVRLGKTRGSMQESISVMTPEKQSLAADQ